jgi:hypothetical protein
MPRHPLPARTDPLRAFTAGAFVRDTRRPVPLVGTSFEVDIDAGLAVVHTKRTFRNAETASIEATITFPVPVHATLFELTARIGERMLKARAEPRKAARETYEDAVDLGMTAVLHEEVLRGVHMLSIGHIAPGAEIEICTRWVVSITRAAGCGTLRIPLTVGDIYGRSPLTDADDLAHGGPVQMGALTVRCREGTVRLRGHGAVDGQVAVRLDVPIDLEITGGSPKELCGRAADGRYVLLRVEPSPETEAPLSTAVLVDRSGSMSEVCAGVRGRQLCKHQAVMAGLEMAGRTMRKGDSISLWEFSNDVSFVGEAGGGEPVQERFRSLLGKLHEPSGGTQIGAALGAVIAGSSVRDVLVITDGKSHDLDVHALARQGWRVQLVLVGDDSLEANVGHLAALTGGEVFVAGGEDLEPAIAAAMASLRALHEAIKPVRTMPEAIDVRRAGMRIAARWQNLLPEAGARTVLDMRAIGAFAASLALPALPEELAAELAQSEGLVTHLTSLVLVDEASAGQEGVPAMRKVALPTPFGAYAARPSAVCSGPLFALGAGSFERTVTAAPANAAEEIRPRSGEMAQLAERLPWELAPQQLQAGDLSALPLGDILAIVQAAAEASLVEAAAALDIEPVVLVIALLALTVGARNRTAARIGRSILGKAPPAEAKKAAAALGLDASI